MAWKKVTPEMTEFLEGHLKGIKCQPRQMFGCPVYFVNDNMFTGLHEDNIILRLSEVDRERITEEHDEVRPFEPIKGRKMREYVVVPESVFTDTRVLRSWLEKAHEYASSLSPKAKKEKKTKKKKQEK